ncbi:MAG: hypothetical protein ACPLRN_03965 [Microgenomates group bacterium]
MKKEGLLAVIFGVIFGSLIGFFLVFQTNNNQSLKNKAIPTIEQVRQINQQKQEILQTLEIIEPNNYATYAVNSVTIKGKAPKNSLIVVQSPIKDQVFVNQTINFKIDFPLARGENVIKVVVYPKDKKLTTQEKILKIYYLQEEL